MTTHIIRRLNSVAGKSFSPLGGGAGERRPSCSHYPKPRGMSFNPLGGGAGVYIRPYSTASPENRFNPLIRALHVSAVDDTKVHRSVSFQSPRRWGGVGLASALG